MVPIKSDEKANSTASFLISARQLEDQPFD